MISRPEADSFSASGVRLLQVMLTPGDGGAETFFEKLAIALQETGIRQRLVICRHSQRRARLEAAGCDVTEIAAKGIWKWFAKRAVAKEARDFHPHIQLAWMSRAAGALSRMNGCINLARLGGYYPLKNYRDCDWLIGNTPGVLEYLEKEGWPRDRMKLISNFGEVPDDHAAIDGDDLRRDLRLPADAPVILTLGRLHGNKAQDILIRAMALIPKAALLIGGEGPLRGDLERLAERVGVSERVRFLGWRRDTQALFGLANVCVFPSRSEPLGNVVLEAWVNGVPIACAASEGPSWLIEHGQTGLLFPINDVEACAAAANRLLRDQELARHCVKNGRTKWQTSFSKDAIVRQYQALFASLIDHRETRLR